MNGLDVIANGFGKVDWDIRALLYVLELIEEVAKSEEIEFLVTMLRIYLESVDEDVQNLVEQLETFERQIR